MFGRLLVACSLIALPAVGVRALLSQLADHVGMQLGAWAALEANWLKLPSAPPQPVANFEPVADPEPPPTLPSEEAVTVPAAAHKTKKTSPVARKPAAPAARGVFVSAANVLRLAQAQAMPRAAFVPAEGARPAGLKLMGVGGLRIGMRDGDILTRVSGAPVSSVGQVVGLVIAARAQRAPRIGGEFWRNGELYALIVEQPYLAEPAAP